MKQEDVRVLVGRLRRDPTDRKSIKTARHEISVLVLMLRKAMSASLAATVQERGIYFRTAEGKAVAWLELEEHTVPDLNGYLTELGEALAVTRERFSRFMRVVHPQDEE